jgi:hypothetical protein
MKAGIIQLLTGLNALDQSPAVQTKIAAVVAIVGPRVYDTVLPRGYTLPAVAVHRYGSTQEYEFAGKVGPLDDQVQIDVYGTTSDVTNAASDAIRALLIDYVGTLPDGTEVQAAYLERAMDMPFMPNADKSNLAFRSVLGFRVIGQV